MQLFVQAGPSENREPEDRKEGRDKEDTGDELSDRAPSTDASNEDSDERRPGDPPKPIGQRPVLKPRPDIRERIELEAQPHHARHVISKGRHEGSQEKRRRPGEEDKQHDEDGDDHVAIAEPLDPFIQIGHQGAHIADDKDDKDTDRHHGRLEVSPGEHVQTNLDLEDPQTYGTGNTQSDGNNREEVRQPGNGTHPPAGERTSEWSPG